MKQISASRFASAIRRMSPAGRQRQFLLAHYKAPGKASSVRRLAEQVGYKNFRGINIQYGLFAAAIGRLAGVASPNLSLLVEFIEPKALTNKEWILVMRPEFAEGLKRARWV